MRRPLHFVLLSRTPIRSALSGSLLVAAAMTDSAIVVLKSTLSIDSYRTRDERPVGAVDVA